MHRRNVDGDPRRTQTHLTPTVTFLRRVAQDPGPDRHDHAGLLHQRDEGRRRDDSACRAAPANERLQAADAARFEVHPRLVVELKFLQVLSLAQRLLEQQLLGDGDAHALCVEKLRVTRGLGALDRGLRVSQ